MRIPLIYIPKTRIKRFLNIEKRYKCEHHIVPIGCDCHPAHTLKSLNLRNFSLPFDWLNMDPLKSIEYVTKNISDGFANFLNNLKRNEKGFYVSQEYPYVEFMHEQQLETSNSRNKFLRRINRLLQIVQQKNVVYIHNLPVNSISSERDINLYIKSVQLFQSKISTNLHIYLRYDENLYENNKLADKMFIELSTIGIKTYKYVRGLTDKGVWGDERAYTNLFKGLDIKLKTRFPKIYVT
jgi:hypothetical protein